MKTYVDASLVPEMVKSKVASTLDEGFRTFDRTLGLSRNGAPPNTR
jgi:hypothetical protein